MGVERPWAMPRHQKWPSGLGPFDGEWNGDPFDGNDLRWAT